MVSANASFRIRLRGNLIARFFNLMLVDNRQVNKYIDKNEVESQVGHQQMYDLERFYGTKVSFYKGTDSYKSYKLVQT